MLNGKIKLEAFVFREAKYGPLKAGINEAYGVWNIIQYSSYLVTPSLDISPLLKMNSPVV